MGSRTARRRTCLAIAAGAALFGAAAYPSYWLSILAMREAYRAGERTGIMNGSLGLAGQILGYSYFRSPVWMHPVARGLGAALGFGPALLSSLVLAERISRGKLRVTLCGSCGRRLERLADPACPACSTRF